MRRAGIYGAYGRARSALRANLVSRAEDWAQSSLPEWLAPPALPWLDPGPVPRSSDWLARVNMAQTAAELDRVRQSVRRGVPFGVPSRVKETAAVLGLGFTLRSQWVAGPAVVAGRSWVTGSQRCLTEKS
jgi:hypothetical protein